MRVFLVGLAGLAAACHGLVSGGNNGGGDDTQPPETQIAIEKFSDEAMPAFVDNGCTGCHEGQVQGEAFLGGNTDLDRRTTILGWNPQVVDLNDPSGSEIITKGAHQGLALTATAQTAIIDWIEAEKTAAEQSNPTPIVETAQFTVNLCTLTGEQTVADCPLNEVQLDGLQLPGAKITFIAQAVGTDLYLTDMLAIASVDGLYLEHPLFTTYPANQTPLPDLIDRFARVQLDLSPSASVVTCPPIGPSCALIGAGDAAFHEFAPTDPITIAFQVLGKYQDDSGPPPPPQGCGSASLASFNQNVAPLMSETPESGGMTCVSCHGVAGSTAAQNMNLANLGSTTDNSACLAALSNVTLADIPQSALLLAPTAGADLTHPRKLTTATTPTFSAFSTAVNTWLAVEQTGQ